ncbi:MAG: ABC transporter permease [Azospirillaceae bacterium]
MSSGEAATERSGVGAFYRLGGFLQRNLHNIGMPVAVLLLCILFSVASEYFLTVQNLRNVGLQAAALAAVALGQTLVVLTGGLDLSVGSVVALVSVVAALAMIAFGVPAGILAGLAAGAAVGVVNGIVVTRLRVFPFIATLAMLSIAAGLALNISGGTPIAGVPRDFALIAWTRVGGVPVPLLISLTLLGLVFLFLRYHRIGRDIYAVGGNPQAARLSGIATNRAVVTAYTLSALCAAVGSLILTARVGSGQPTLGTSLPLESVAAVVLGGVSLFGGRGSVLNVAMGVAFVSVLSNGLNLLNVSSYTQMMVIGLALILAVALDRRFAIRE